jgi:D-arginine dehydrogenase
MQDVDILVIGAGIPGVGLAAMIGEGPKVAVVDMEDFTGYHTTSRSAHIYIEGYGSDIWRSLTDASYDYLNKPPIPELENSLLSDRGILYLCELGNETLLDTYITNDMETCEITLTDALQMVPIIRTESFIRAAYNSRAFDIDVASLHQGWLKHFRGCGNEVHLGNHAMAMEYDNGYWHIETTEGNFRAPIVVNAAGAWADNVAKMASLQPLGLLPLRRSMTILPAPEYAGFNA